MTNFSRQNSLTGTGNVQSSPSPPHTITQGVVGDVFTAAERAEILERMPLNALLYYALFGAGAPQY